VRAPGELRTSCTTAIQARIAIGRPHPSIAGLTVAQSMPLSPEGYKTSCQRFLRGTRHGPRCPSRRLRSARDGFFFKRATSTSGRAFAGAFPCRKADAHNTASSLPTARHPFSTLAASLNRPLLAVTGRLRNQQRLISNSCWPNT